MKEDWPTIYKIKYAMADLLYFQQRWSECGPAFDAVVAENPQAPEAAEAAYASVLCYQNIYEQTHTNGAGPEGRGQPPRSGQQEERKESKPDDEQLAPKEFTDNQKGMITAFNRYICYIHPAAGDAQGQEQLVEVKYARARTYFEAQHWEEAAAAFRDIAMNHSDKDVGIYAAQLYLESVNVLGAHSNPPRPSCFDDMAADVPKFIELYCTGDKLAKNQEQCTILTKIQCDIQRLKAQKLVEVADKRAAREALAALRAGGQRVLELWQQVRRGRRSARTSRRSASKLRRDRLQRGPRLPGGAPRREGDPRAHDRSSTRSTGWTRAPLAKKATLRDRQATTRPSPSTTRRRTGTRSTRSTKPRRRGTPTRRSATRSLLRLGLGQEDEAIADAKLFMQELRRSEARRRPRQIAFAIGAHYADKEDWDKAQEGAQRRDGRHQQGGRRTSRSRRTRRSRGRYTHSSSGGEGQREGGVRQGPRALGRTRHDADRARSTTPTRRGRGAQREAHRQGAHRGRRGELLRRRGAAKQAEVDTIKFPEYTGAGTKDDVLKHVKTKVKPTGTEEEARPSRRSSARVQEDPRAPAGTPPPRWVIAAGSRVGLMWGNFVDEFRARSYPEGVGQEGLRARHGDSSAGRVRRLLRRTSTRRASRSSRGTREAGAQACLDYSVKYQYFDEFSRDCEKWLAKNYKAEYHVVDELRGAPTLSNSGLDDSRRRSSSGGPLWHPVAGRPADEKAKVGRRRASSRRRRQPRRSREAQEEEAVSAE